MDQLTTRGIRFCVLTVGLEGEFHPETTTLEKEHGPRNSNPYPTTQNRNNLSIDTLSPRLFPSPSLSLSPPLPLITPTLNPSDKRFTPVGPFALSLTRTLPQLLILILPEATGAPALPGPGAG